MLIIKLCINTISELKATSQKFGVELSSNHIMNGNGNEKT